MTADHSFEAVLDKIRTTRNFDFRNYKRATLRRRIERRVADRKCRNIHEYLRLLDQDADEFEALIEAMLIKVTGFFRDRETWEVLRDKVIPQLLDKKQSGSPVRIWCAGCATGEEAYSLAMLVAEHLGSALPHHDVKIFGTDVDVPAVAHARRAVYARAQCEGVPAALLKKWFSESSVGFTVRQELRRLVVFGVNNLVADAPISRLDMLTCRNVFIYHDTTLQRRILTRFHYALRRGGILVLGKSELIPFAAKLFEPVDLAHRIYRKDSRADLSMASQERILGLLEQEVIARAANPLRADEGSIEQFYSDVIQSSTTPLIGTSLDGSVNFVNTAAARLWAREEGELVGRKLSTLGLPGLTGDVLVEKTALVREGRSERESADGAIYRDPENTTLLSTVVTPLRNHGGEMTGILYVVNDVTSMRSLEKDLRRVNEELQSANEELQTTNEELQSANQELETTNEELQSANEELQTTNEELQSTNEELETTNEELQSTNSELDATNRELAHRTEEMNFLTLYQRTIIRSLSAAVIVIDPHGRITVWNLAAERLLGLPEGEAIGQALWTLRVPALGSALITRIRKSISKNLALRVDDAAYELPAGGRGSASVAAVPLLNGDVSLGAVILFEDLTRAMALGAAPGRSPKSRPAPRKTRRT